MRTSPSQRGESRRQWLWFVTVAVVLTVAVFGRPLFTGQAYSQADLLYAESPWSAHVPDGFAGPGNTLLGDMPMIFYPDASFARDRIRHGRLPLWNPLAYGGQPFLAAMQTALFSPLTLLVYLVPLPDALTWLYMARILLGGLGMFVLLGSIGVRSWARLTGSVAWLLAPFTVVWLGHPLSEVSAWLPWLVWATRRACLSTRWRDVARLALVTGAIIVAGHPETALKALLLAGALACVFAREARTGGSRAGAALVRAACGVLIGAALAAIQILPTLEYLQHSRTLAERGASAVNIYVLPPETAVTAVVPNFFGHPVSASYLPMENRYGLMSNYAEQQVYAGIVIWLLAATGAWHHRRDPVTWALVIASAGAALLMYGISGFVDLAVYVPGLSVAALSRFGMVVTFCAVWLAARGLDALLTPSARVAIAPAAVTAVAMAGLVVASLLYFRMPLVAHGRLVATLAWTGWAAVAAIVTLVLVRWRTRRRGSAAIVGMATVTLVAADLVLFAWGFHPTVSRALVFPRTPEIAAVQSDGDLYRVAGWNRALLPNTATVYGLADIRGYDGIEPAAWSRLLETGLTRGQFHQLRDASGFLLLDLLNVRYVFGEPGVTLPAPHFSPVLEGGTLLWRNTQAFPRAFLTNGYVVVRDDDDLRDALRITDLRHVALLEAPPHGQPAAAAQWPAGAATETATIAHYDDTLVEIETTTTAPRLLVLSDNDYPGWHASVDGIAAPILRVDGALRGVFLTPGHHRVRFEYIPRSLRIGATTSAVAGLLVLLLLCYSPGRRRRRSHA